MTKKRKKAPGISFKGRYISKLWLKFIQTHVRRGIPSSQSVEDGSFTAGNHILVQTSAYTPTASPS